MKKVRKNKTTDICVSIYDGQYNCDYSCVGVTACQFSLCHCMPPDGSEECCRYDHGMCTSLPAQQAALANLIRRLKGFAKEIEDAFS